MKVELGELNVDHADLIAKWKSDKELSKQIMSSYKITNAVEAKEWITNTMNSASQKLFGIFLRQNHSSQLVGITRLMYLDLKSMTSEFGIYLGERNVQGKGIGHQALKLTLEYGFNRLNLRKIYLRVNANNEKAIQLYIKHKFNVEGVLKEHFLNEGIYEDVQYMSLFRQNFEEINS